MFVCLDGCSDYFAYVSISTVGKTGSSILANIPESQDG